MSPAIVKGLSWGVIYIGLAMFFANSTNPWWAYVMMWGSGYFVGGMFYDLHKEKCPQLQQTEKELKEQP